MWYFLIELTAFPWNFVETEGTEAKRDKVIEQQQSANYEFAEANMPEIQDLLKYFRNELEVADEDDILYHSLVVLLQDMDQNDTKPIHEYILNGKLHWIGNI